jgi:serine/threonine protein kinase
LNLDNNVPTPPRLSLGLKRDSEPDIVGTLDYMAPELISRAVKGTNGQSHEDLAKELGPAVDWWALGCIIYECVVGISPFNDGTEQKVRDNILGLDFEWIDIGYGEDMMTPETQDLISKLLDPDQQKRLGSNGIEEFKDHDFFKRVNWDKVRSTTPPRVPSLKNLSAIENKSPSGLALENVFEPDSPRHGEINQRMFDETDFDLQRLDLLYDQNILRFENYKRDRTKMVEKESMLQS